MLKQFPILLTLVACTHASAINIDLGAASGYNIFIKENFTELNADSQGKIAIGGNADIGQYDVGVNYEPGSTRSGIKFWTDPHKHSDVLVVGGNLTTSKWAWGNVKGNLILGGELTAGSSANAVSGTTTTGMPIDFNAAFSQFNALSLSLAGMSSSGEFDFVYNNWLRLSGTGDNGMYVANITGDMLRDATDLSAIGLNQNDTLIINVSGKDITFDSINYGQREDIGALNMSASHILYNFFEAENITFSQGLKGNILAPNANFKFLQGDLSGQVIAKSWTGGPGAQANLWDGFFVPPKSTPPVAAPPVSTVPEPSSVLLLVSGLLGVLLISRKRT